MGHPMARVDRWNRSLGTLYRHDLYADLSAVRCDLNDCAQFGVFSPSTGVPGEGTVR